MLKSGTEGMTGSAIALYPLYKRRVLENADQHDRKVISKGNTEVHGGDVLLDAWLLQETHKKR